MSDSAFPTHPTVTTSANNKGIGDAFFGAQDGMTKREYYAAAAMPAIINRLGVTTIEAEVIARMAFQMADAMIKESGK